MLIGLAVLPFVVFGLLAEDVSDYYSSDYNFLDVIFAFLLVGLGFLPIGLSQRVTRICARDKLRVELTRKVARSFSIFFALNFALFFLLYSFL